MLRREHFWTIRHITTLAASNRTLTTYSTPTTVSPTLSLFSGQRLRLRPPRLLLHLLHIPHHSLLRNHLPITPQPTAKLLLLRVHPHGPLNQLVPLHGNGRGILKPPDCSTYDRTEVEVRVGHLNGVDVWLDCRVAVVDREELHGGGVLWPERPECTPGIVCRLCCELVGLDRRHCSDLVSDCGIEESMLL
ncbi:hypothetical protein EJ03DRAFT_210124 [Teratosphaeria nubilosa]|uniref:Uncharacterized protein n=1 Tax=Teratosphaeria nubilosa TaxID=161662 RepID=A0A6G1KYR0_9PEZI|nr:hypothetical protein EJ03DRAFT_210124 [Teratosphaeria nubilosa]